MSHHVTLQRATEIARDFFGDYVNCHRQWSTDTVEGYLPRHLHLAATINGPITIKSVARQIYNLTEPCGTDL